MKLYVLALIIAFPLFFSCTKTKYVDKVIHDTATLRDTTHDTTVKHDTTIIVTPTLIGSWDNHDSADLQPTFGPDSMKWSHQPYYAYVASHDSIFLYGSNHVVSTMYAYRISPTNDTLWLTYIWIAAHPTKVFYRVN